MNNNDDQKVNFKVTMLAYPGMTMLDAIGPNEVLSNSPHFTVQWVSTETTPISNDLSSFVMNDLPHYTEVAQTDILLIPGGPGDQAIMQNKKVLAWIKEIDEQSMLTTSVCTGALILAKSGVLKGQKACTHWACLEELRGLDVVPVRKRYTHSGKYITASGVSAGIDMALYLLQTLVSKKHANDLRFGIEYFPNQYHLVSSYSLPSVLLKKLSNRFKQFYSHARERYLQAK